MRRALLSPGLIRQLSSTLSPCRSFSTAHRIITEEPCILCQHGTNPDPTLRPFSYSRHLSARSIRSRHSVFTDSQPHGDEASASSVPGQPEPLPTSVPDISTHYTIFPATFPHGPPPGSPFDVPLASLRREFIALQSLVHPDKSPPGLAKQTAEALSARINEAYRTLSDPLARAQYLLAYQHGVDMTAEDGAKAYPQDQDTLTQVLEVQEAVEEAKEENTIAELKRSNEERVKDCVRALGVAVDRGDVEGARRECVKLRFWYTIREGLREWEPGNTSVSLAH